MGNILKKPIAINPELKTLEEDQNFKSITVQYHCQLCHFPVSPSSKFTNNNNCSHTICKHCIAKHINSKLEINAIEITCPGPDCKVVLDPVSCSSIVDGPPYKQWLDRLCYAAIAGREKCYCPHGNCRALIVDECCGSGSYPTKSQCPECKRWLCFFCRTPWHEGQQCDLSRRREMISLNDMLFMGMTVGLKKKLSCCPNCRMYSERLVRDIGLCIVRCRCKTVFCFHCEREVTRLSCDCGGFQLEIKMYNCKAIIKCLFLIFLLGLALWIWVSHVTESDAYY